MDPRESEGAGAPSGISYKPSPSGVSLLLQDAESQARIQEETLATEEERPPILRKYPRFVITSLLKVLNTTPEEFDKMEDEPRNKLLMTMKAVSSIITLEDTVGLQDVNDESLARVGMTKGQFLTKSHDAQTGILEKVAKLKSSNRTLHGQKLAEFHRAIDAVDTAAAIRESMEMDIAASSTTGKFTASELFDNSLLHRFHHTTADSLFKIESPIDQTVYKVETDLQEGLFGYPMRLSAAALFIKTVEKVSSMLDDDAPIVGDKHAFFTAYSPPPPSKEHFVNSISAVFSSKKTFLERIDRNKVFNGGKPSSYSTVELDEFQPYPLTRKKLTTLWNAYSRFVDSLKYCIAYIKTMKTTGNPAYLFDLARSWYDFSPEAGQPHIAAKALEETDSFMRQYSTPVISAYIQLKECWMKGCDLGSFVDNNYVFIEYLRQCGYDPSRPLTTAAVARITETFRRGGGSSSGGSSSQGRKSKGGKKKGSTSASKTNISRAAVEDEMKKNRKELVRDFCGPPEAPNVILKKEDPRHLDYIKVVPDVLKVEAYNDNNDFYGFDILRNFTERLRGMFTYMDPIVGLDKVYKKNMDTKIKKPVFVYYANVDEMFRETSNIPYPDLVRDLMPALGACNNPLVCINQLVNQFLDYYTPASKDISSINPLKDNEEYGRIKKKMELITGSPVLFISNSMLSQEQPHDLLNGLYFQSISDQLDFHGKSLYRLLNVYKELQADPENSLIIWRLLSAKFDTIAESSRFLSGAHMSHLTERPELATLIGKNQYYASDHTTVLYSAVPKGGGSTSRFHMHVRSFTLSYLASTHLLRPTVLGEVPLTARNIFMLQQAQVVKSVFDSHSHTSFTEAEVDIGHGGIVQSLLKDAMVDAFFLVGKIKSLPVVQGSNPLSKDFKKIYTSHFHPQGMPSDIRFFLAESALDIGVFWIKYLTELYRIIGMKMELNFHNTKEIVLEGSAHKNPFNTMIVYTIPPIPIFEPGVNYEQLAEFFTKDMSNLITYLVAVIRVGHLLTNEMCHLYSVAPAILVDSMIHILMEFHVAVVKLMHIQQGDALQDFYQTIILLLNCVRLHYFQGLPAYVTYNTCGDAFIPPQFSRLPAVMERYKNAKEKKLPYEGLTDVEREELREADKAIRMKGDSSKQVSPSSSSAVVFQDKVSTFLKIKDFQLAGMYTLLMRSNPSLHGRLISIKGVMGRANFRAAYRAIIDNGTVEAINAALFPAHKSLFTRVAIIGHSSRTQKITDLETDTDYNTVVPKSFRHDLVFNRMLVDNTPAEAQVPKIPYELRRNSIPIDVKYTSVINTTFIDPRDKPFALDYTVNSTKLIQDDIEIKDFNMDSPFIFGTTYRKLVLRIIMDMVIYKYDTLTGDPSFIQMFEAASKRSVERGLPESHIGSVGIDPNKMGNYYEKVALSANTGANIIRYLYALALFKGFYYKGNVIRHSQEVDVGAFLSGIHRKTQAEKHHLHDYLVHKKKKIMTTDTAHREKKKEKEEEATTTKEEEKKEEVSSSEFETMD